MVAASNRMKQITLRLLLANLCIWGAVLLLFQVRYWSQERPTVPGYRAFPYGEIRIGVDASVPPFAFYTDDGFAGLDIDLGYAIGTELELPVRFVPISFDGLYDAIITDQVDMVISALTINPALTADVRYTQSYFDNGLLLVTTSDSVIQDMTDLPGQRLAYEFGSRADSEVRTWSRRLESFEMRPYELPVYALDALRLNQADAALVDATAYFLYQRDHPDWQSQAQYITHNRYAIALRIDRRDAYDAVSTALESLMQSDDFRTILDTWL